ncbi:DNA-binding transcriptional MerR regulator [Anaerobacterium chartisolvens]|uniref:DNA-binding transcriptional MerR regulator n=1 Tax=Anaerobacterium chartisolvens TaxID=1297424 RepID=A0A369BE04_9FIRM|nr:MerR family transcriptional regulator [Anaerobacterium chartisolvens]RCX18816.1 DNA-binding transcriptional MerR regulator [Anaerobacterium chartisolvens]
MAYSIKQVSEQMHIPPHTLRYYEKEGLLPSVKRSAGGSRAFSESDLDWLGLICCLKNTGMSIKQIRDFVDLSKQGDNTLKQRCEMLVAHKKAVKEQIAQMEQHLDKVTHKIGYFTSQYERYRNG